jgi:hypothetical protein
MQSALKNVAVTSPSALLLSANFQFFQRCPTPLNFLCCKNQVEDPISPEAPCHGEAWQQGNEEILT